MNILSMHDQAAIGGVETRLLVHARALQLRGHRVYALCAPGPMEPRFAEAGIAVTTLPCLARDRHAEIYAAMRRLIREKSIDFCDLHAFWCLLPGALASLAEGVPFALNFHGLHADDDLLLLRATLRLAGPFLGMAVANSPATRRYLQEQLGVEERTTLCVPNAIDESAFRDAPAPARPARRLLLLSRLDSDKLGSLKTAVRFAAAYARRRPEPITLRVAGAGDVEGALREECARLFKGLGVGVEWAGPVTAPEQEIARADAVLGMGRAVLEGLAARRPAIVCGVLGNLAGPCRPESIDEWFASNLNGRGGPDVPPEEAAAQLERIEAAQGEALAGWVARHAGLAALEPWAQAIEEAGGRPLPDQARSVGETAALLLEDYFAVALDRRKLREEGIALSARAQALASERDERLARVSAAARGLVAEYYELMACARGLLRPWPPGPMQKLRRLVALRRERLPAMRQAIDRLNRSMP